MSAAAAEQQSCYSTGCDVDVQRGDESASCRSTTFGATANMSCAVGADNEVRKNINETSIEEKKDEGSSSGGQESDVATSPPTEGVELDDDGAATTAAETAKSTTSTSSSCPPTTSRTNNYTLVIGFSTGHAGTTSLNDRINYREISTECKAEKKTTYDFTFEPSQATHESLREWYRTAPEGMTNLHHELEFREEAYVREVGYYPIPPVAQQDGTTNGWPEDAEGSSSNMTTMTVALGHDCLFYYRGILRAYNLSGNMDNLFFIRIRRSRFESATSFESRMSQETGGMFTLTPNEQPQSIVLMPPTYPTWNSMNGFKKALWYVDEVEARWQKLIQQYPHLKILEVQWSKYHPHKYGTLHQVMEKIAQSIGLEAIPESSITNEQQHGTKNVTDTMLVNFCQQNREYFELMNYTKEQHELIKATQFPECPI